MPLLIWRRFVALYVGQNSCHIFLKYLRIQNRVILISFLSQPINRGFSLVSMTLFVIEFDYWMRLSIIGRIMEIEEGFTRRDDNTLPYLHYYSAHTTTGSNNVLLLIQSDSFVKNMLTSIDVTFPTSFGCF